MDAILPRWMKVRVASKYASIGQKKLKRLAEEKKIIGYRDPDTKRNDWVFDRHSIDEYRSNPIKQQQEKINKILDLMKKRA